MTEAMVERWLAIYSGSTRVTAIGTLLNFAEGRGELPAHVFDAVEHRDIFTGLRDVYFRQKGMNPPPFSVVEGAEMNEEAGTGAENVEKTEEQKADEASTGEGSTDTGEASTGESASDVAGGEGSAEVEVKTDGSEDEKGVSDADQAEV